MPINSTNISSALKWLAGGILLIVLVGAGIWFFFFRAPSAAPATNPTNNFEVPADTTGGATSNTAPANGTQVINTPQQTSQTKIFQIAAGPVVGATLIQTLHPTTTLARYISQEDGHVYDLPLDVPGAVPRVVSNITIPGGVRALWVEGGRSAVMQYLDGAVVKTVYLGFPVSTSTASAALPTRIQFLPDAMVDIAASPDGKSVAYLLKTAAGVDGYTAKVDGTGSKKLFSLPLSQMLISWPSQSTLLTQTKSATGVPGIAFSVDVKSGAATSLVYAPGLTAIADATFSKIIYQTTQPGGSVRTAYVHDVKTGLDRLLSFSPYPEKCIWSAASTSLMYCAASLSYLPQNYLDLWHLGASSVADALLSFNVATGKSDILGPPPGGADGGVPSDIFEMALSPNEHYLSFTTKGSRSLWGVRLTQ